MLLIFIIEHLMHQLYFIHDFRKSLMASSAIFLILYLQNISQQLFDKHYDILCVLLDMNDLNCYF